MNPSTAPATTEKITNAETACGCDSGCACNFGVFEEVEKERHSQLMGKLGEALGETVELPDGYAFRLNKETISLTEVAEWITFEQRCCSFFTFELEFQANDGPLWLKLRGNEDVKEFLRPDAERNTVFDPKL